MLARPEPAPDRYERSIAAIERLLGERGLGRFALFNEVGEGTIFPDGTESMSGHVVDDEGSVFFFWTGWDEADGRPVFSTWEPDVPDPSWLRNAEYRTALAAVGRLPEPRR